MIFILITLQKRYKNAPKQGNIPVYSIIIIFYSQKHFKTSKIKNLRLLKTLKMVS